MIEKRGKAIGIIGTLILFYLFILSIIIIKESSYDLGKSIIGEIINGLSPLSAIGLGWLITVVMQSGGAATAAFNAAYSSGAITTTILVFMIIGTRIGTNITALFASLLINAKRRDFRHGFEIGLVGLIYSIPIAIIMFILEYFFKFFSSINLDAINLGFSYNSNIIALITSPIMNLLNYLPNIIIFLIGIFLIIITLAKLPEYMKLIWGEENLKEKLNKYLGRKSYAFAIGFILTSLLLSTSITITILIPIIVSRLINLKKAIPYIIGSNLGSIIYPILSGLALGKVALLGIIVYTSFSIIGLLWLFNMNFLFNITKYISKRTLHISKSRALIFVIFFVIIALILTFL